MAEKFNFAAMSVLVVDNSPFTRKLAVQMLRSFGFGFIRQENNAKSALQTYCDQDIILVFVETTLEENSGIDVIKSIRTSDESPNTVVPILATCGHPVFDRISKVRDAGATEMIAKPFSPNHVLDRILYMVERPREYVRSDDFFGPDRRRNISDEYKGEERREAVPEDGASSLTPNDAVTTEIAKDLHNAA